MSNERGVASILVVAMIGVVVTVGFGVAVVSTLVAGGEQANTAAESAALGAAVATYPPAGGAVVTPQRVASEYAARNGAAMVTCRCSLDRSLQARIVEVSVVVRVSAPLFGRIEIVRKARAEFDPMQWLGY